MSNIFHMVRGRRSSAIMLEYNNTPPQSRPSSASSLRDHTQAHGGEDAAAQESQSPQTQENHAQTQAQAQAEKEANANDKFLPNARTARYRSHSVLLHSDELEVLPEPGLYAKYQRITAVKQKKDALTQMNDSQLKNFIKNRKKVNDTAPLWIDIQGMETQSLEEVLKDFSLHPLTLEDCGLSDTLEKIENRNDYTYLVINDYSKHPDNDASLAVNLNVIFFHDLIITVHAKPVHSIYAVIPKLEFVDGGNIPSIEFVLYLILSRCLDYYEQYINKLEIEADALDEEVLELSRATFKFSAELLGRINVLMKQTSSLLIGLSGKREIFTQLLRNEIFSPTGLRYMKNAFDHLLKLYLKLNLARDELSDINSLYMSKLSVEQSVVSNEVGIHMRRFGVIGALFLPLNLIAGVFGMNTNVPFKIGTDIGNNIHPFIVLMVIMLGITVAQIVFFHKLKWL